jgi:hypothetical protein
MMLGVFTVRVAPDGWLPRGFVPSAAASARITTANVEVDTAMRTPQFWLLWTMLCLNVTAGIGVLGQASAMIQEIFPGRVTVEDAAKFVMLLSFANLTGRFLWSSLSDYIGRRATYATFFALGTALYASVPSLGRSGNIALFVGGYAVILTMYGGGFATIPAYLKDMFGSKQVGAIHGRLLTAWSTAGVLGPVLVNYLREHRIAQGVPKSEAYGGTMYVMAGLLVVGFVANLALRAVDARHHATTA